MISLYHYTLGGSKSSNRRVGLDWIGLEVIHINVNITRLLAFFNKLLSYTRELLQVNLKPRTRYCPKKSFSSDDNS